MPFDKAKAIRAAEKHLAQGKVPAAIEEYRRIVENDTDDFTSLNTLGDLYIRTGGRENGIACFKRVAEHYRVQGFTLKAVAMYKKVLRYTPEEPTVAMALAALYEQQGLLIEARAQYLTVEALLARRGSAREALEVLQRVADLDPNDTNVRVRLAEGFEREKLSDLAAQAFTEAGDRLFARGEHERALEVYSRALVLRPHAHAALQGMLVSHTARGTADEAAEILEGAVKSKPGDLELHAMLVRAHVESENAEAAERVANELIARDPSCYAYFFEIARLCLRQKDSERAVSLVGRIIETALTGREDAQLLELLEESLRRDPEHLGALMLLARIHEWQRNDLLLRTTLERLAEAAEASGDAEVERKTLARIVRLTGGEPHHHARLSELGGAPELEEHLLHASAAQAAAGHGDVPTFESFLQIDPNAVSAHSDEANARVENSSAFAWETGSQDSPGEANVSTADVSFEFAGDVSVDEVAGDANEFTNNAGESQFTDNAGEYLSSAAPPPAFEDFGHVVFDEPSYDAQLQPEGEPSADARESMLQQELSSIDFYVAQGYNDIALSSLEMLESQYGDDPRINERRRLLNPLSQPAADAKVDQSPAPEFSLSNETDASFSKMSQDAAQVARDASVSESQQQAKNKAPGIDPGLAAIFDEFREAVEDEDAEEAPDFDTHYNLGLAYKDIELYDSAVESFQTAIQSASPGDGTPRYLHCCNMLGHCFARKGMHKLAAMWFRRGLDAPGHTEDEYQALRYELAEAYERMGDVQRAIDVFSEVYGIDVTYRGVAERLRELHEQQTVNEKQ